MNKISGFLKTEVYQNLQLFDISNQFQEDFLNGQIREGIRIG
jgi:hypothetical protein